MNFIEKLLKNKQFSVVFMILAVVVAAVVVPNLSEKSLSVLDNTTVRVIVMVLIVGLSLVDPVKALLLAIILVVALMKLMCHKRGKNTSESVNNNNIFNNIEVNDEVSDEGSNENPFDESVEENELNTKTGLEENNLLQPENSELLNDNLSFNDNNSELNSVNEPVVLGDVPTNSNRKTPDFNAVPYNNGVERADANLEDIVDRDAMPNKIVIGSLLNEGFENPLVKNNLGNNTVDDVLSSEDTDPNNNLNNVLTANVPPVNNTLEPVNSNEVKTVFTNEWQLQDIGTNLVNCGENTEKVKMAKETLGAQGNSEPSGHSF